MPTIEFRSREIECAENDVLRDALLEAGASPHNGRADALNCRGHGTCGTCAVSVDGSASEMGGRERRRLSFPPHDLDSGLRLACQTRVEGDVGVENTRGSGVSTPIGDRLLAGTVIFRFGAHDTDCRLTPVGSTGRARKNLRLHYQRITTQRSSSK